MQFFKHLFSTDDDHLHLLFHGAAREVTGSMHLVELGGHWVAIDCGLYQGHREQAAEANARFPVKPRQIEAVILSHAHIDHSGNLPFLVKEGFVGPIYCTPATRDLSAIMLQDSGHIQEEDAAYWNKKHPDDPIEPYYTRDDAKTALSQFVTIDYGRPFMVLPRLVCQFAEAGHILGSATVLLTLEAKEGGQPVRLCFTGDLGRRSLPILRDPAPLPACDYLLAEATYGNRVHEPPEDMKAKLADVINRTVARGGRVVIPAFSVGRTQSLIFYLRQVFQENLAPSIDVFIDSPLAVNATEIFRLHPDLFDEETTALAKELGGKLFDCPRCHYITDVEQSKALNSFTGPCVIISASGMCEAGRILHHLKHAAPDKRNTIAIVGYMAANTLGRRLVDRVPEIKIFGKMYPLEAEVVKLNGLSSHAGADELMEWILPLKDMLKKLFIVHSEPAQAEPFARRCREAGFAEVDYPQAGEGFMLD
ncbi:MAG: MBL fold metallo-hydrolase [Phycisphaerae bacterium]|nr:MBL fold metallo-hydrolase [Phycisphaerae bacterium]